MNKESSLTCKWVMSHIWISHVANINESCHTYKWVMLHIRISHVTHENLMSVCVYVSVCLSVGRSVGRVVSRSICLSVSLHTSVDSNGEPVATLVCGPAALISDSGPLIYVFVYVYIPSFYYTPLWPRGLHSRCSFFFWGFPSLLVLWGRYSQ